MHLYVTLKNVIWWATVTATRQCAEYVYVYVCLLSTAKVLHGSAGAGLIASSCVLIQRSKWYIAAHTNCRSLIAQTKRNGWLVCASARVLVIERSYSYSLYGEMSMLVWFFIDAHQSISDVYMIQVDFPHNPTFNHLYRHIRSYRSHHYPVSRPKMTIRPNI